MRVEPDSPPREPPAGQVRFVSRSAAPASPPSGPARGAGGEPLPRLADRDVLGLLALVALLLAVSWARLEGYQLADSVEFMERAQAFARGHDIDATAAIRSFGFSALLVPFFAVADWLGLENLRPVVALVRVFQMLLALLLVRVTVRIGARLAGRRAGLVAGFAVGVNPIYLQYGISPISDVAAALCLAQALELLIERGDFRRGLRAGLWLGAALLMAYKTMLVGLPALALVLLRDRWRRRALLLGALAGFAIGVAAQVALDKLTYGTWGQSLYTYLLGHFGNIVSVWVLRLGDRELAQRIYDIGMTAHERVTAVDTTGEDIRSLSPVTYYLTHLPQMIVWPLLLCGVLGLARCVKRAHWRSTMLAVLVVLGVAILSRKGSKDFRLWLPLLPAIAAIVAWGWELLHGERGAGRLRALVAWAALPLALVLGQEVLAARNTRKFSGYWRAIDLVAGRVEPGAERPRVASAYHWAVFLREAPGVELVKLPHLLDDWAELGPDQRAETLAVLGEMDWFLVHLPVLTNHPSLMAFVNERFQVEAFLWEHGTFEDLGQLFVLRRWDGDERARRFFQVVRGADPDEYRRRRRLDAPVVTFVRTHDFALEPGRDPHYEEIRLLGWEYQDLPGGSGHGWITYHWYCATPILADYTIVDRLTTYDERAAWQNDHAPAYGVHRTASALEGGWQPGWIVRESWPVVAAADPFDWRAPYRPLGGAYRRGDLVPAWLWLELATFAPSREEPGRLRVTGRMEPARAGEHEPLRRGALAGARRTPEGHVFSVDDLLRVGGTFLPVPESARLADDGKPVPEPTRP